MRRPQNTTGKILYVPDPAAYLRDEAVKTRRLARFYDDESKATGSRPLALAAAIAYQRAEDLEADAKGLAA